MLGPFLRTPPPSEEKERMVVHAVVWAAVVLSLLITLLSVLLPLRARTSRQKVPSFSARLFPPVSRKHYESV